MSDSEGGAKKDLLREGIAVHGKSHYDDLSPSLPTEAPLTPHNALSQRGTAAGASLNLPTPLSLSVSLSAEQLTRTAAEEELDGNIETLMGGLLRDQLKYFPTREGLVRSAPSSRSSTPRNRSRPMTPTHSERELAVTLLERELDEVEKNERDKETHVVTLTDGAVSLSPTLSSSSPLPFSPRENKFYNASGANRGSASLASVAREITVDDAVALGQLFPTSHTPRSHNALTAHSLHNTPSHKAPPTQSTTQVAPTQPPLSPHIPITQRPRSHTTTSDGALGGGESAFFSHSLSVERAAAAPSPDVSEITFCSLSPQDSPRNANANTTAVVGPTYIAERETGREWERGRHTRPRSVSVGKAFPSAHRAASLNTPTQPTQPSQPRTCLAAPLSSRAVSFSSSTQLSHTTHTAHTTPPQRSRSLSPAALSRSLSRSHSPHPNGAAPSPSPTKRAASQPAHTTTTITATQALQRPHNTPTQQPRAALKSVKCEPRVALSARPNTASKKVVTANGTPNGPVPGITVNGTPNGSTKGLPRSSSSRSNTQSVVSERVSARESGGGAAERVRPQSARASVSLSQSGSRSSSSHNVLSQRAKEREPSTQPAHKTPQRDTQPSRKTPSQPSSSSHNALSQHVSPTPSARRHTLSRVSPRLVSPESLSLSHAHSLSLSLSHSEKSSSKGAGTSAVAATLSALLLAKRERQREEQLLQSPQRESRPLTRSPHSRSFSTPSHNAFSPTQHYSSPHTQPRQQAFSTPHSAHTQRSHLPQSGSLSMPSHNTQNADRDRRNGSAFGRNGSMLGPFNLMVRALSDGDYSFHQADLETLHRQLKLLRLQLTRKIDTDRVESEALVKRLWLLVTAKEDEAFHVNVKQRAWEEFRRMHERLVDIDESMQTVMESIAPTFERLDQYNQLKIAQRDAQAQVKSIKFFNVRAKLNQDYAEKILNLEKAVKLLARMNEKKERLFQTKIKDEATRINNTTPLGSLSSTSRDPLGGGGVPLSSPALAITARAGARQRERNLSLSLSLSVDAAEGTERDSEREKEREREEPLSMRERLRQRVAERQREKEKRLSLSLSVGGEGEEETEREITAEDLERETERDRERAVETTFSASLSLSRETETERDTQRESEAFATSLRSLRDGQGALNDKEDSLSERETERERERGREPIAATHSLALFPASTSSRERERERESSALSAKVRLFSSPSSHKALSQPTQPSQPSHTRKSEMLRRYEAGLKKDTTPSLSLSPEKTTRSVEKAENRSVGLLPLPTSVSSPSLSLSLSEARASVVGTTAAEHASVIEKVRAINAAMRERERESAEPGARLKAVSRDERDRDRESDREKALFLASRVSPEKEKEKEKEPVARTLFERETDKDKEKEKEKDNDTERERSRGVFPLRRAVPQFERESVKETEKDKETNGDAVAPAVNMTDKEPNGDAVNKEPHMGADATVPVVSEKEKESVEDASSAAPLTQEPLTHTAAAHIVTEGEKEREIAASDWERQRESQTESERNLQKESHREPREEPLRELGRESESESETERDRRRFARSAQTERESYIDSDEESETERDRRRFARSPQAVAVLEEKRETERDSESESETERDRKRFLRRSPAVVVEEEKESESDEESETERDRRRFVRSPAVVVEEKESETESETERDRKRFLGRSPAVVVEEKQSDSEESETERDRKRFLRRPGVPVEEKESESEESETERDRRRFMERQRETESDEDEEKSDEDEEKSEVEEEKARESDENEESETQDVFTVEKESDVSLSTPPVPPPRPTSHVLRSGVPALHVIAEEEEGDEETTLSPALQPVASPPHNALAQDRASFARLSHREAESELDSRRMSARDSFSRQSENGERESVSETASATGQGEKKHSQRSFKGFVKSMIRKESGHGNSSSSGAAWDAALRASEQSSAHSIVLSSAAESTAPAGRKGFGFKGLFSSSSTSSKAAEKSTDGAKAAELASAQKSKGLGGFFSKKS